MPGPLDSLIREAKRLRRPLGPAPVPPSVAPLSLRCEAEAGATWHRGKKKFTARVKRRGRTYVAGDFTYRADAIRAAQALAQQLDEQQKGQS